MLIIGAGGFAKEVLQVLEEFKDTSICFYDDINNWGEKKFLNEYRVLQNEAEAVHEFEIDGRFTIGVGRPIIRQNIYKKFSNLGGVYTSVISSQAYIGQSDVVIGKGANILSGVKISNSVSIGIGVLVYYNAIITHDVLVGDFVEVSPAAILLGRSSIGDGSWVGSGAIIFPDIKIGRNVIIGAGAVVKTDIPDNSVAVGIPAKIVKQNLPIIL